MLEPIHELKFSKSNTKRSMSDIREGEPIPVKERGGYRVVERIGRGSFGDVSATARSFLLINWVAG